MQTLRLAEPPPVERQVKQLETNKRNVVQQAPRRKAVSFMESPWGARSKLADI
jgi:hypothetical protein